MSKQQKILKDTFASALYRSRINHDCSQSEFAELCAVSPRAYEDLELSKSLPSFRTFINISIACNLDVNKLISKIKENGYEIVDGASEK